MHRGVPWMISFVAGIMLAVAQSSLAEPYAPRIGQRHADFTLPAIGDGKPASLSDYRGQKVLLVHFASW